MAEKEILERILENTEQVKEVVVTKETEKIQKQEEKKEKRKEQLKEAQSKFKQIKANVKPDLYEKIIGKAQDGNVSAYLLKLIDEDLNTTPNMFETIPETAPENTLKNDAQLEQIRAENSRLKSELEQYKNMNIKEKLKFLFNL